MFCSCPFVSERLGEFRVSRAEGQIRASPTLFQERATECKGEIPAKEFLATFACLVDGRTLPFLYWERGSLLLQTSSTINTSVWNPPDLLSKLRQGWNEADTHKNKHRTSQQAPSNEDKGFFQKVPGLKRLDCKTFKTSVCPRPSLY